MYYHLVAAEGGEMCHLPITRVARYAKGKIHLQWDGVLD